MHCLVLTALSTTHVSRSGQDRSAVTSVLLSVGDGREDGGVGSAGRGQLPWRHKSHTNTSQRLDSIAGNVNVSRHNTSQCHPTPAGKLEEVLVCY